MIDEADDHRHRVEVAHLRVRGHELRELAEILDLQRVRGVREDDAAWREDQQEVVLSIDEVAALRECLETGRDVARVVEAWGRRYRTTWSLDPPSELWEVGAYLWRYPMSEARMTLRIAAAPLRAALAGPLARWLQG